MEPGQFRFFLTTDYSTKDKWNEGSRRVTGPFRETSSFLLIPEFTIGLGHNFEFSLTFPWAHLDAEDDAGKDTTSGMGDLLTRISRYGKYASFEYLLSLGAYWPTGDLNDGELPSTASFSSGTINPDLGISVFRKLKNGILMTSSINFKWIVSDNDQDLKLGSTFVASAGVNKQIFKNFNAQLYASYLYREKDETSQNHDHGMNSHDIEYSGGHWIYLQPSVSLALYARPSFAVQIIGGTRIPILQDVVGMQLVESVAWNIGIAQTINF